MQSILSNDKDERHALQEFAALEFQLNSAEEIRLQQHLDTLKQDMHVSATELASLQSRLCDREASVQMKTAEAQQLKTQLTECKHALESARLMGDQWQQRAEQFEADRQQAAANVRKAEKEVDLIAQENASLVRQVNYIKKRLLAHTPQLEASAPEIAKLARELQAWCDKESAQK